MVCEVDTVSSAEATVDFLCEQAGFCDHWRKVFVRQELSDLFEFAGAHGYDLAAIKQRHEARESQWRRLTSYESRLRLNSRGTDQKVVPLRLFR